MRLSTLFFASLRDDPAEADMVRHKLLGMPTIVTFSPRSLAAGGVEAELRGAA